MRGHIPNSLWISYCQVPPHVLRLDGTIFLRCQLHFQGLPIQLGGGNLLDPYPSIPNPSGSNPSKSKAFPKTFSKASTKAFPKAFPYSIIMQRQEPKLPVLCKEL